MREDQQTTSLDALENEVNQIINEDINNIQEECTIVEPKVEELI